MAMSGRITGGNGGQCHRNPWTDLLGWLDSFCGISGRSSNPYHI